MISGIGVGGQHFRLGLLQIFWKMLNSIVTIVSYTRTSSSVWLFSMSHFTWLASLDMYLNSHNFRKPSRLILKCSYEFLKCSKEFESPARGKHRDATRWSFPTEAGGLLDQSQALMHILTWSSPIVHELFNGSSEYNEQPYSGEKCLPCPDGIKSLATLFRPWDQLDYLCRNWKLRRVFLNSFQAGQGRRVHQQFTTPLWCRYRRHEVESELLAPR